MKNIEEKFQRISESDRMFDIRYWQAQGDLAIFKAVTDMLRDYMLLRGCHADEFRIQRTIESFRKT